MQAQFIIIIISYRYKQVTTIIPYTINIFHGHDEFKTCVRLQKKKTLKT